MRGRLHIHLSRDLNKSGPPNQSVLHEFTYLVPKGIEALIFCDHQDDSGLLGGLDHTIGFFKCRIVCLDALSSLSVDALYPLAVHAARPLGCLLQTEKRCYT
jgi:hypothetical protein